MHHGFGGPRWGRLFVNYEVCGVYVNDCMIIAPLKHIEHTKAGRHDGFRMKDLGQARSILGMAVMHN